MVVKSVSERGVVLIPVLIVFLVVMGGVFMFVEGDQVRQPNEAVLSSGSGSDGESDSEDSKDEVDSSGSGKEEDSPDEKDEAEVRVETVTESGVRIRVRNEDDRERTDFYYGGTKLRIETKDGETRVKVENEDNKELDEISINDEDQVEFEGSDEAKIRVSKRRKRHVIGRDGIEARSDFPVTVDLETNELVITTPAGERRVAILPDTAIANMLAANAVERVSRDEAGEQEIDLKTLPDGSLAYEVHGVADKRLLGLFKVAVKRTAVVSAETGEVVGVQRDFLSLITEIFSF